LRDRGIRLSTDVSNDIGTVRADPGRIQQVVWNLLSNAVKFTPSGGHVDVDIERAKGEVAIRVRDTGIGIPAALLPKVFERVQQGESGSTRKHSGLGLGLAIARQLVELHGGNIDASSEGSGKGATFTVRLPLAVRSALVDDGPSAEIPSDEALTGLRVLVVEDEDSAREAFVKLLSARGAVVQAFGSATAAREAFDMQPPDILVSDIGLPDEDGYRLIRSMRSIETRQGIARTPAVALTAFARPEDRERALAAGFDSHLAKPIDPDVLFSEIAKLASSLPRSL
jgi:CheY-like chemotaxis protein